MSGVRIDSPAKINLHLRVADRRPDGFHDIESLFLALDFGDTLLFETTSDKGATEIHMDWQLPDGSIPALGIPDEDNIVSKAVSLFRSRSGYEEGLKITVEKRVPLGGGLGGGSSNAAATLSALNRLAAASGAAAFDADALAEMGAHLGSDVPFFSRVAAGEGAAAWVTGRGEHVMSLKTPREVRSLWFLLVCPGFRIETSEAFDVLDEWREGKRSPPLSRDEVLGALSGKAQEWPFFNDFLAPFAAQPNGARFYGVGLAYKGTLSGLAGLGAEFAGLSGSGSSCFGAFAQRRKAETAKRRFFSSALCRALSAKPPRARR